MKVPERNVADAGGGQFAIHLPNYPVDLDLSDIGNGRPPGTFLVPFEIIPPHLPPVEKNGMLFAPATPPVKKLSAMTVRRIFRRMDSDVVGQFLDLLGEQLTSQIDSFQEIRRLLDDASESANPKRLNVMILITNRGGQAEVFSNTAIFKVTHRGVTHGPFAIQLMSNGRLNPAGAFAIAGGQARDDLVFHSAVPISSDPKLKNAFGAFKDGGNATISLTRITSQDGHADSELLSPAYSLPAR